MPWEKWKERFKEANADELAIAFDLIKEVGARNSTKDKALLQTIHDHTIALGAGCAQKEAVTVDLTGDIIALREGAVGQDGTAYLKLIAPGWGSSGYYSKEMLARDIGKAFPAGTKNFWNHQTAQQERERPEGDLRDLASVLTEDAHYEENGPDGPGGYAKVNVQPHFREHVDSLAKYIGTSIRAIGHGREGKAEGKAGPIIEQLTRGISVDYVTTPGAGGKILQLFEAARSRALPQGDNDMDEAAIKKLIADAQAPLIAENKKLRESFEAASQVTQRGTTIAALLEGIRLPQMAKDRIIKQVRAEYPLTEAGATDDVKLKALVEAAVKDEATYLEQLTGRPVHLGTPAVADSKVTEAAAADFDKRFNESLNDLADVFLDHNEESDEKAVVRRRAIFAGGRN